MEEAKPSKEILHGVAGLFKIKERARRKSWKAQPEREKAPYSKACSFCGRAPK
jgi:hypothetical protein